MVNIFTMSFEKNKKCSADYLQNRLNELRKEGTFCDITLRVGEKTIPVHKNVICAFSPYFSAILSGPFRESKQEEIVIKDIDANCLECIIDFMYTGLFEFDSKNVMQVLLTASFLQIKIAEDLCRKFLIQQLDSDNCIEYLSCDGKTSIENLLSESIRVAVASFPNIFYKNDFLELELDVFRKLTQELTKYGYPEDLVFLFILRWIDYSQETRINFTQDLLEGLDRLLISPDVFNYSKITYPSYPISNIWTDQSNSALESTSSSNDPNEQILVSPRFVTFDPLTLKLSARYLMKNDSKMKKICGGSYAYNGYHIYHQGGWKKEKEPVTDSYVSHPNHCVWFPFVPLQEARAYHNSCVLNGTIYSVGGSDGFKTLSSVEFIDLYSGQRGFTEPLPRAKVRAGLALHENAMYVVGGSDRGMNYKCIHRLDVREGKWQELAPSPYRAGASSCGVVGENIYTTHPDTMQRYDIRANNWELISAPFLCTLFDLSLRLDLLISYKVHPKEVFSLDNTLFGIFNDRFNDTMNVAKFVLQEGEWEYLRPLREKLPYFRISTNPNVEVKDERFEIYYSDDSNDSDDPDDFNNSHASESEIEYDE